jgi:hypothetical protein
VARRKAQTLYAETEASIAKRENAAAQQAGDQGETMASRAETTA